MTNLSASLASLCSIRSLDDDQPLLPSYKQRKANGLSETEKSRRQGLKQTDFQGPLGASISRRRKKQRSKSDARVSPCSKKERSRVPTTTRASWPSSPETHEQDEDSVSQRTSCSDRVKRKSRCSTRLSMHMEASRRSKNKSIDQVAPLRTSVTTKPGALARASGSAAAAASAAATVAALAASLIPAAESGDMSPEELAELHDSLSIAVNSANTAAFAAQELVTLVASR